MNNIQLAINTTFVGLTVVFLALILLSLAIFVFSKFLNIKKESNGKTPDVKDEASILEIDEDEELDAPSDDLSDDEIVAVLTAAVLASMRARPESKIRVKSFRRIPGIAPAWNATGRLEQISAKL